MKQDEKTLVQALHRGERYACEDMINRFSGKIYKVALRLTGQPEEAEEVLQETFIKACRGVENFEGRSSLGTWLYRIATNNGLMRLRRRQTPTVSLDRTSQDKDAELPPLQLHDWYWEPETVVLTDELRRAMDEAVASLPDTLRGAFVLRDLEGLSTQEAAEALNISPGSLKVRLHRARLLLREYLETYFSKQPDYSGNTP
jgi:RNA polymerase sigma-70 factor (ECF subfamily)